MAEAHGYEPRVDRAGPTIERLLRWQEFLRAPRSEREWSSFLAGVQEYSRAPWGLFTAEVRARIPGARVLDFGAGRGLVGAAAAMMGAADAVALDIHPGTADFVRLVAERFGLERLRGISGDLREEAPRLGRFDLVLGANVLHHLETELEGEILGVIADLLEPRGLAVFVEPCEQSRLLASIKDRLWPDPEPHPERPSDLAHYAAAGRSHFAEVSVRPFGSLERWVGLVPRMRRSGAARSALLAAEASLPAALRRLLAASQRIECREPLRQRGAAGAS